MLGQMRGQRVATRSSGALTVEEVRDRSVRESADVAALASRDARSAAVLVWNYHDDDLPLDSARGGPVDPSQGPPPADVEVTISGLPNGRATVTHYRVDRDHSNSYTRWKAMGSPQSPTKAQIAELEAAGRLQQLVPPSNVTVAGGRTVVTFTLPRQGVSLLKLTW
jgi:xylan 1,4-beta-xylosidase